MVTAAISGALALGSAIYGGIKSSQANNRARQILKEDQANRKRWHEIAQAEDWTMRADAQARMNKLRELLEESDKRAARIKAVSGATDEATALQKEATNKAVSDAMVGEASMATQSKEQEAREYRNYQTGMAQQEAQSHQQQAAQTAQAASQAVNAGIGLMGTDLHFGGGNAAQAAGQPHTPSDLNASGQLTSPTNTDLTGLGNQQLGITSNGLPTPRKINA